jgi:hypothetical protein
MSRNKKFYKNFTIFEGYSMELPCFYDSIGVVLALEGFYY